MRKESMFPYSYLIEAIDKYYGMPSSSSSKKKSATRERYVDAKPKVNSKKRRLSILIATFWDYPHTGGLSNYITALSEGLKKLGHKVDIISPNQFLTSEVRTLRKRVVPELRNFFYARYGSYNTTIVRNCRHMYIYEMMLLKNINLKNMMFFMRKICLQPIYWEKSIDCIRNLCYLHPMGCLLLTG